MSYKVSKTFNKNMYMYVQLPTRTRATKKLVVALFASIACRNDRVDQ